MCKCGYTVTAASPTLSPKEPIFHNKFDTHMFNGEKKDQSHVGLHSLYGKKATKDYKFESAPVLDANCNKIFSAKVCLADGSTKAKDGFEKKEKLSCFFPTDMCPECVTKAITLAWKHYEGNYQTDEAFVLQALAVMNNRAKWAGQVTIAKGNQSYTIWVGSPETGRTANSAIISAFPAIGGAFF